MWTKYDTQMLSSIEVELNTIIDAYTFELEEFRDLSDKDRQNIIDGIKYHHKQIEWLEEIRNRLS